MASFIEELLHSDDAARARRLDELSEAKDELQKWQADVEQVIVKQRYFEEDGTPVSIKKLEEQWNEQQALPQLTSWCGPLPNDVNESTGTAHQKLMASLLAPYPALEALQSRLDSLVQDANLGIKLDLPVILNVISQEIDRPEKFKIHAFHMRPKTFIRLDLSHFAKHQSASKHSALMRILNRASMFREEPHAKHCKCVLCHHQMELDFQKLADVVKAASLEVGFGTRTYVLSEEENSQLRLAGLKPGETRIVDPFSIGSGQLRFLEGVGTVQDSPSLSLDGQSAHAESIASSRHTPS